MRFVNFPERHTGTPVMRGKRDVMKGYCLHCIKAVLFLMVFVFCLQPQMVPALDNNTVPKSGQEISEILPPNLKEHPLSGVILSSPRATLSSFLIVMDLARASFFENGPRSKETTTLVNHASQCLNLTEVPPFFAHDVAFESALLLESILNRIELPALDAVPNSAMMKAKDKTSWTIPFTEITISKALQGPQEGNYLFSPFTVKNLKDFYNLVHHLPHKKHKLIDPYESYIFSFGWILPQEWIMGLPQWMKKPILDQTLLQWMGLVLSVLLGTLVVWLFYRWECRRKTLKRKKDHPWHFEKLFFPAAGMSLSWGVYVFIDDFVNITGTLLNIANLLSRLFFFIFAAMAIIRFGNILVNGVTASSGLQKRTIDDNLVRLSLRVLTLVMLFGLFWYAATNFGLSVQAVFASAGIVGLAIAMAARETLANFFGGVSLLMDRPFRAGDYIILDSGERGEVIDIGLRSTRIFTRDEILICIPNSVVTNAKIVNESAPRPKFRVRIKIGVAYGSDVEQVEKILMEIADKNDLAAKNPPPRVRFRAFGDSSLDFELLCWTRRPQEKGRLVNSLNKSIYHAFNEAGIVIPFPQRDVHLQQ